MNNKNIEVIGARVHNLKNIDVTIPRNSLTVITGLSGSGKSSLAFDTIYAEGQRRYMETLSSYARQFVGNMERPDVDKITGLSPVVAIEQKTTNKNPRSTVGTVTEINDFLRLLYARASTAYSYVTAEQMVKLSDKEILSLIKERYKNKKIAILSPIIRGRKGHYRELFDSFIKKGFLYACVDGEIVEIYSGMKLDRYVIHNIELVVDRLKIDTDDTDDSRLVKSIENAMKHGKGTIMIYDYDNTNMRYYSRNLMCPTSGIAYDTPAPHTFSFNSPSGACPDCKGLGYISVFDINKLIPDKSKSINQGAIEVLGKKRKDLNYVLLEALALKHDFSLDSPINELSNEIISIIIDGDNEPLKISAKELGLIDGNHYLEWSGISGIIEELINDETTNKGEKWKEQFVVKTNCGTCDGTRLKKESLYFKIADKNIGEVAKMSIDELYIWIDSVENSMTETQKIVAKEILKEIKERLGFLIDVGLGYLSLSRSSGTLSGGESQRIRLATQIGSKLVNVLYILDEPSIGLHQRDNMKLIDSLKKLRDAGNSVIVVEHDEDMIRCADWIIDIGPGAGVKGGFVSAIGTIDDILKSDSITSKYLNGTEKIEIPTKRRIGNGKSIKIVGAKGNNLKNIDVEIPLGCFVAVSGVSGSGKSSLINGTLKPIISKNLYRTYETPLEYRSIDGIENIDKLVVVDQSPIGRTPRSNPATYTGLFTDVRKIFEMTPDAKVRGFSASRFSFNVSSGRCEECKGAGVKTIEMNFLPDVYVTCNICNGKRYNRETLEVLFKGKSINDVLDMTIRQASEFFESVPKIKTKLNALLDVGLGYLRLGQPCTTLSGGESQRIKLATELSKKDSGNTLFLLDEPTTGLHFKDINVLLKSLNKLVDRGNTVLVIEHNLDVLKTADYLIDIGKEGGKMGGKIVFTGSVEDAAKCKNSYTGQFLKNILKG